MVSGPLPHDSTQFDSYHDRQQAQWRTFMHWVKTEGGHEGPTHFDTLLQPRQLGRVSWLKEMARGKILEVGCLVPGTLVVTASGLKPIEDVRVGDYIYTHTGQFHPVYATSRRLYHGTVIGLRTRYSNETVWLTPEHPVLVQPVKKPYPSWKAVPTGDLAWIPAGELDDQTWAVYPLPSATPEQPTLRISLYKYQHIAPNRHRLPSVIDITPDFAELVGRFVGDGSTAIRKWRGGVVTIPFELSEKEAQLRLQNIGEKYFGIKAKVHFYGGMDTLTWYSVDLAEAFRQEFGAGSFDKHVPIQYLGMDVNRRDALMKGLIETDGHINSGIHSSVSYSTISPFLAWEVQQLFASAGQLSGINRTDARAGGIINGRVVKSAHDSYRIKTNGQHFTFGSLDTNRTMPFRSIEHKIYEGEVYNLGVATAESFCTPSLTLHNCNTGWVLAWCHGHTGVDIRPMNIELAKILAPNREFYVADAVSLPFPDKSFTTVLIPETLEHLDFPDGVRRAIKEAERVATDRVLITLPDGRTDNPDALNFKHAWLFDEMAAKTMMSWMPGANLAYFYGFGLIFWPVGRPVGKG